MSLVEMAIGRYPIPPPDNDSLNQEIANDEFVKFGHVYLLIK